LAKRKAAESALFPIWGDMEIAVFGCYPSVRDETPGGGRVHNVLGWVIEIGGPARQLEVKRAGLLAATRG